MTTNKQIDKQQKETIGAILEYLPIEEAFEKVYRANGRPKGSFAFDDRKKFQFCALLLTGVTEESAAYACGVTSRTVRTHKRDDPVFAANVDVARARSLRGVEQTLYALCLRGNLSAIKYWLNNRYPEFYQDRKPPVEPIDDLTEDSPGFKPTADDVREALTTLGVSILGIDSGGGVGAGGTSSEDSRPEQSASDSR